MAHSEGSRVVSPREEGGLRMFEGSGLSWGLAALALVPLVLVLVTSFIKISVVLSFLRHALGAPEVPSTVIILAVSVMLSAFVMAPVGMEMFEVARPLMEAPEQEGAPPMGAERALALGGEITAPLGAWLLKHAGEGERDAFVALGKTLHKPEHHAVIEAPDSLLVIVPAFVLTELKEAFIIAFIIFVPFLVLDMLVASILLSLNMHMVSPAAVSLPFKLLLFVLIDGWSLLVQGLVLGYA